MQPDGTVDLLLLGPVRVVRKTVEEIRDDLNERYKKFYRITDINVTRVKTQTKVTDLLEAVNNRFFSGGQGKQVRVTPEGTISLPSIGVVPAQGLTLDEIGREVQERYRQDVRRRGADADPAFRAPRFVYVVGEVRTPGRFEMVGAHDGHAIHLAGGRMERGRQLAASRRLSPGRGLAAASDQDRHSRRFIWRAAGAFR